MAVAPVFYDIDGDGVDIGDVVTVEFQVVNAVKVKPDDRFPTVTLQLKHDPQGMKLKIDTVNPPATAPACVLRRILAK
jgi:hypothetical protein